MTSLTTAPHPRSPASLSLEVPGKQGVADTHLSWFLQPSSLPSRQVSPPEHRPWPHTLSPAASGFCLRGGVCWGGVATSSLGEGRAPLPQAPKQNQPPLPQTRRVYKVGASPRIPSLKLGRKWGRGGGGDKAAGCSAQRRSGPRLLPAVRRAPRSWPSDAAPRVPRAPGEGVMGVPPRHKCSRRAGAAQDSSHRPLSIFHSSVRHAGNKH